MEFEGDTVEVGGLDKLAQALKKKPPVARVGILGAKTNRAKEKGAESTNAEIGAAHEYGSLARGIPQRSFLRMPIGDRLQGEMERSGLLTEGETKKVLQQGTLVPWLRQVAALAEGIVKDAFNTKGFGKWPGWRIPGYTNRTGQVLVDTTQLRDSITSEVKDEG